MTTPLNPSTVLVTGGTGTLGRHVVPLLRDSGADVRVLSRRGGDDDHGIKHVTGDLATGDGVEAALDDVAVVVHLAGSSKGDDDKARHIAAAAARGDVRHLVYISVVGADRVPVESAVDRAMFGYFGAKLRAEHIVAESGAPWTTLRATQFHQSLLKVAQAVSKLPVVPAPRLRFQPIDAGEVADRLVQLTLGRPAGLVPDMAGPQIHPMTELLRIYLRSRGKRRPLVPVPTFGKAAAAFRAGANLAADRAVGHRTWAEFLATPLDVEAAAQPAHL